MQLVPTPVKVRHTHSVPVPCDGVCSVGVYSDLADGAVLLLTGVGGGVTHIAVSPDGNLLFVGFRKVCSHLLSAGNEPLPSPQSNELKVWDLRNPGNQLAQLHRPVYTNQRLYFDLYRQVFVCYCLFRGVHVQRGLQSFVCLCVSFCLFWHFRLRGRYKTAHTSNVLGPVTMSFTQQTASGNENLSTPITLMLFREWYV